MGVVSRQVLAGLLCALLSVGVAFGQGTAIPGPPRIDVFNFMDYGAVCDGSTNDDAAINAAFAAAAASPAYQNNNAVTITGTSRLRGCVMNSINATLFTKGTGANTRPRVNIREMTLLCTGAGNTCIDTTGSKLIKMSNVSIRGDNVAPPAICVQVGVDASLVSAAWHSFDHVNCNNEFTFAALYNMGSEANTYFDDMWTNSHTSSGPIGTLGAITAGSGYTNGTFTSVPLVGGVGNGALATVVVAGNVVTSVTITYQGKDYAVADALGAPSLAGGTGFSIPVATVAPMAAVIDGQNYWRETSAFTTVPATPNVWIGDTLISFVGGSVRQLGSGPALWLGWSESLHLYDTYILNSSGTSCVTMFDNSVPKAGIPGPHFGFTWDGTCEQTGNLQSMVQFTGSNPTPTVWDMRIRGYHQGSVAMLAADPVKTSVTLNNADLDLHFGSATSPVFSPAKVFSVSGKVAVASANQWNAPASFKGQLVAGGLSTPPGIGPVDIISGAGLAVSCARLLSNTYAGPLCQVTRSSDSTTLDIYPNAFGDLDRNAYTQFCKGSTCAASVMYDQSGNGNNFTQATAASQPVVTMALTALGNRPALLFGDQSAFAMTATHASTIDDAFVSGGYLSMVTDQTGSANQADRALYKSNGGATGWEYRCGFVGTSRIFVQGGATTSGVWTTQGYNAVPHVEDAQYSSASLSNNPVLASDGTNATVTVTTAPTGTIASDAAVNLLLGNNAATAGTRGFPGYIAEVVLWKITPTALQIEAIRRSQAAYYGVSGVN